MVIALARKKVIKAEVILSFRLKSPLDFAKESFHFFITPLDLIVKAALSVKLSIHTPLLRSANHFRFIPKKNAYDTRRRKKHGF